MILPGSFTLTLPDCVAVTLRNTVALSGNTPSEQQTAGPEPATMLLLGTGLAGLAGVAGRGKARAKDQGISAASVGEFTEAVKSD